VEVYDPVQGGPHTLYNQQFGLLTGLSGVVVDVSNGKMLVVSASSGKSGLGDFSLLLKEGLVLSGIIMDKEGKIISTPKWQQIYQSHLSIGDLLKIKDPTENSNGIILGVLRNGGLLKINVSYNGDITAEELEPEFELDKYCVRLDMVYALKQVEFGENRYHYPISLFLYLQS